LLPLVASVTRFVISFRSHLLPLLNNKTSSLAVKISVKGYFYPRAQLSYNPKIICTLYHFNFLLSISICKCFKFLKNIKTLEHFIFTSFLI